MPPTIQTLDDWNDRLDACGCCNMPVCPPPYLVCEQKDKLLYACGVSAPSDIGGIDTECPIIIQFFQSRVSTVTVSQSGVTDIITTTDTMSRDGDGVCVYSSSVSYNPDPPNGIFLAGIQTGSTTTWTGGIYHHTETWSGGGTVDELTDFTDPETEATLEAAVLAMIDAIPWSSSGSCFASRSYSHAGEACPDEDPSDLPLSLKLVKLRYRFRIPTTHTGTYFKIEWDEVFYPKGWDEDGGTPPSILAEKSVEWTGPGTGAEDDPSWLTAWNIVNPPAEDGDIEIRNIAFICYHGTKFGSKPQYGGPTFIPA
jgi:hypothetical protein